jgi:hypothetical protein
LGKYIVELSTRMSCDLNVYKPRILMSEVLVVVSSPGLKKRAAIPPKPQFVSSERTTKGKASRFFSAAGAGIVSALAGRQARVCTEKANSKKVNKPALIMEWCLSGLP